jgi:glycosyltransferase involved in cell wall biosynthesis
MDIFVIGPVPPFRGGIAHSNSILCRNLSKRNKVRILSFSRMFPAFLYPGKRQKEAGGKKTKGAEFIIDSVNPLNWLKIFLRIKREKPDVVVFQWWTTFLAPCYFTIAALTRLFTKAGVYVVCQNVLPHEKSFFDSFLTGMFFRAADCFITLSKNDVGQVKALVPEAKVSYLAEPTYDSAIEDSRISKHEAKKKLGIKGKAVLFFGFVRPYKGLDYLIEAMPLVLKDADVTLVIAGEFWKGKGRHGKRIRELGIADRVKIIDSYIPDKEVINYFRACEAVVLPYTSSTESGIIQLAFGFNTPVITTAVGGNADYLRNGVNGLLVPPENAKKLAQAIVSYYKKNLENKFKANMIKGKETFSWTEEKEKVFLGTRKG